MKQTLRVDTKNYDIVIADDEFSKMMGELESYTAGKKRLFVVSKKVYKLYKDKLGLNKSEVFVLKDGEKEKNFKNYIKILNKAIELGLTRSDVIISVGGGVVGDIAGFAASTYMRGIDYIQVPTTLLSMVDSSVGGKTAIDVDCAKNIVGTFYQPKRVYININFLKTLDKRQYYSGIGEVLKYAFIEESCGYSQPMYFYEYLTLCYRQLFAKDSATLMRVIECCLKLKIAVINVDEKEVGLRKVLNFGHTYGHTLEVLGKFKKYFHGEAVVQGMYFALNWAYIDGLIQEPYYKSSLALLAMYGFKEQKYNYNPSEFLEIMKHDKKAQSDKITFILPCDKRKVKELQIYPQELLSKL